MSKRLSVLAVLVLWGVAAQEPSGVITTAVGNGKEAPVDGVGGSATTTPLHYPSRLAVDNAGNLYFIDRGAADRDNLMWKVSPTGALTRPSGTSIWGDGLALDASGNAYVSDERRHVVYRITPAGVTTVVAGSSGVQGFSGDGAAATAARLNTPRGVAFDTAGNLFIADTGNNRIRKVTPAGVITTVAGAGTAGFSGDGAAATAAQLSQPKGVAVDTALNLYIADTSNHRVRKVTAAGIISTLAGPGVGSGTEQFEEPIEVALDPAGNLFVADRYANKIRRVSSTGAVTTVAGTGTRGYSGDGGPATSAQLNLPGGVAVDGSGNLYIADSFNFRIRKVPLPVSPGGALVIVTSSPLPTGTVGTAYSTTLVAGGGTPSYRWSLSAGSLPGGLSLASTTGVLSGTPTSPGTFTFTVRVTDSAQPAASATKAFTMAVQPPVPSGTRFCCLGDTVAPATQPSFGLTLDRPYPLVITGEFTLSFAADAAVPADDAAVQFIPTGGRTLSFVIPANSTNVVEFPQGSGTFQTGTTAGVITVRITALTAGGVNILPSPAPSMQVRVARQAPVITSARTSLVSGGFQVVVVGYATSRELTRASFSFSPVTGTNLQTTSLAADVASRFAEWYRNPASAEHGSRFTLTVNFNVQGDVNAVSGASVTLTNAQGDSASAPATR